MNMETARPTGAFRHVPESIRRRRGYLQAGDAGQRAGAPLRRCQRLEPEYSCAERPLEARYQATRTRRRPGPKFRFAAAPWWRRIIRLRYGLVLNAVLEVVRPDFKIVLNEIQKALRAGSVAYLLKSTVSDALLAAIRSVHAGHRHVPADVASRIAQHLGDEPLTRRQLEYLNGFEMAARTKKSRRS